MTIRDVAREAGVSVATVSNWMNGRSDSISAATADHVAQTAERLSYRPSSLARGLRGHPIRVLGLIVPSVANPSMPAIVRGAEDRAREDGYSLFLSNIDRHWDKALESTLSMLDHGVSGIGYVFSVGRPDHEAPAAARAAGVRVSFLLPYDPALTSPEAVTLDNEGAMRQVAHHLWNLGHRRIGFATTSLSTENGPHRLAGLRAALQSRRGGIPDELVFVYESPVGRLDEFDEIEAGRQAGMALLSLAEPPTAVVAVNDMLAVGILQGAAELGMRVPDDVSVVGFDDLAVARVANPPVTTMALRRYELGRELAELLIAHDAPTSIRRPELPTLIARASTGVAPRSLRP